MSIAEAARLYCEDKDITPEAFLGRIVKEYAAHDAMPEFQEGFAAYQKRQYRNPYPSSVEAQAWDRGLEAAARYAGAASANPRELDAA